MQALITIDQIVNDVLLDVSDFTDNDFMRALRFVERGIGEIRIFHSKEYEITKLEIGDNLCASLPDNYVRHSVIGVYKNRHLIPLSSNQENMVDDENCETSVSAKEFQDTSGHFGHKGGLSQYGEYTINQAKHRIEFSNDLRNVDVFLKYVSTGLSQDTLIPVIYREALISYVKWKVEKDINMKNYLKTEYYEEVGKLRESLAPTMHEIYDAILSGQNQVARR